MTDKPPEQSYDDFYRHGGWPYNVDTERSFVFYRMLQPLRIPVSARVLEIGCGMGLHAELLAEFGLRVTAVDASAVAIDSARRRFPHASFICADAYTILCAAPHSYDFIYARGLSWFHYELTAESQSGVDVPARVGAIVRALKPGGVFLLQVRTNFSGTWDTTGIRNHTWSDLMECFTRIGELVLFTDWYGLPLPTAAAAVKSGSNACVAIKRSRDER